MTRRLEIHQDGPGASVKVDGREIANDVTGLTLRMSADAWPEVWLNTVPDEILFAGQAVVHDVPLDGIERCRVYVRERGL